MNTLQRSFIYRNESIKKKLPPKEDDDVNIIVGELKKLDETFSTNVKELRGQIEVASLDYTAAQKNFDKLEKEYIAAKTFLFIKKERKDHLTSELCSFIKQNELAKAKMLSSFVGKMELVPCPPNLTNPGPENEVISVTEEEAECSI